MVIIYCIVIKSTVKTVFVMMSETRQEWNRSSYEFFLCAVSNLRKTANFAFFNEKVCQLLFLTFCCCEMMMMTKPTKFFESSVELLMWCGWSAVTYLSLSAHAFVFFYFVGSCSNYKHVLHAVHWFMCGTRGVFYWQFFLKYIWGRKVKVMWHLSERSKLKLILKLKPKSIKTPKLNWN